jgi:hypothetical protein
MVTNDRVVVKVTRPATPTDVEKRRAWEAAQLGAGQIADPAKRQTALDALGKAPPQAEVGGTIEESYASGGKPVFWTGPIQPIGPEQTEVVDRRRVDNTVVVTERRIVRFAGQGRLNVDFLLYHWMGMDLRAKSNAELQTLRMPLKLVVPFIVLCLFSLVTPSNHKGVLDRFYAKMKTPTAADPEEDHRRLKESYADPSRLDGKKLFPGTNIELQKPGFADVFGFFVCLGICFLFVGLAVWVTSIGN